MSKDKIGKWKHTELRNHKQTNERPTENSFKLRLKDNFYWVGFGEEDERQSLPTSGDWKRSGPNLSRMSLHVRNNKPERIDDGK